MSLVVTGLSHHSSDVALRERLHFDEKAVPGGLLELRKRLPGAGVAILSTCNRVEVYVHHDQREDALHEEIIEFLAAHHDVPAKEIRDAAYTYSGREAAGHLFRVTSSLDSLVIGEGQIVGQVHDAFIWAQAEQATDKVLSRMFQHAFAVAKDVHTRTRIGEGKVSVSSVAIDLAASIFGDLRGKTVAIVGSGEMGELTLKSLADHGASRLIMVNRSIEKAQALAEKFSGDAQPLDRLPDVLPRVDILITSTAAPDYILTRDQFRSAIKARGGTPMFAIDIAVPRDVDPAVNDVDGVYLYDMDGLQEAADANMESRRGEIDTAMAIVDTGVQSFSRWLDSLAAEPAIVSMVDEMNAIRADELAKTLRALRDLSPEQQEEIEYLTKRIVNKILQRPLSQLKREMSDHTDPHSVLHLVRRLFGLKESS